MSANMVACVLALQPRRRFEIIIITDVPAIAGYLLGMSYPSFERQHAVTLYTLGCTLRPCVKYS